ncbi:Clavaminate synthase-like protein [Apostasia shenzhenica]|uniref:Clavaminate synthase-like protein n=1 Tax=Apostasia shenzhenica TaxID=1088818 RepID=A0A2I0B9J9_9ASPA|nr:Clavaminate synthase-like protein [Apostasia shenzhenica]
MFAEAHITGQKITGGIVFPAVVISDPAMEADFQRFAGAARDQRSRLEALLHSSGALLLRGYPVRSAADFNAAVEAFGYEELPYVGGAAPRTNVVGRVFTANESPPDQKIPFHHEMAQVPEYPSKLFFFCEVEPRSGGETPIVLSHYIYERMKEKHPDFVKKLEKHGLIYTRILGAGDDPSSPIGRGWQSTFLTKDRRTAEERFMYPFSGSNVLSMTFGYSSMLECEVTSCFRAAKLGMKLEWMGDGVKTVMGPIPAIKFDETRGRKIWFNSMVAAYTGWKDARNDPVKAITFGDGSPLPSDIIYDCLKILEEESVSIPWKQGDILLIDNLAVLHSRRSFEPPRRILASLCK